MNLQPHIARARRRLQEIEKALASFDFSSAARNAYEKLSREHQSLSRLLALGDRHARLLRELADNRELIVSGDDPELAELARAEIEDQEAEVKHLERRIKGLLIPPHPNDGRNIIVEIRPAAGGEEAGLFAGDLLRMYTRFAERKGWRLEILEVTNSDLGGVKAAAFSLQGSDVFRSMRYESGVHRVQRIPVTESGGRIHTSTVTVAVLPEAREVEVTIGPNDLRIDVFRSSGPGGQCVNTTDSAVRITHLPSGLSVVSQQEKSQHQNREIALRILRSRLLERRQAEEAARNAAARRQQLGTGDRSERIRTYNFPQNRVTDHRFGITHYNLAQILEGGLDDLIEEIIAVDSERRLLETTGG